MNRTLKRLIDIWTLSGELHGDGWAATESTRAIKYAVRKLWPDLADTLDELAKDMVVIERENDYNEFRIRDANGGKRWKEGK